MKRLKALVDLSFLVQVKTDNVEDEKIHCLMELKQAMKDKIDLLSIEDITFTVTQE